jgi:hypothetical protein
MWKTQKLYALYQGKLLPTDNHGSTFNSKNKCMQFTYGLGVEKGPFSFPYINKSLIWQTH